MKKICDFPSSEFYNDELKTPKETRNIYWKQLEVLWPKKGMLYPIVAVLYELYTSELDLQSTFPLT